MAPTGSESVDDDLLAIVVKALEPYDIPTERWSKKDREEPARAVLAALGPDDLDRLVGSEAKDAESVYWFAKAAVKADRARLPRHRDIVWNIWDENVQRRVGWLYENVAYVDPFYSLLEVVTELHDGVDCPFLDGDDIPMVESADPLVIEAPTSEDL